MSKHHGNVFGGMLLIAGSCIGAGMLGIPIVTGIAGFLPSLVMLFVVWAFMTLTGLLIVEVNGCFSKQVNFVSMVGHSLGRAGRWLTWVLYLFLFYSLLVAYTVDSGDYISRFARGLFPVVFPKWAGSAFFVLLFGGVVYMGTRTVDLWNRVLMFFKVIAYGCLIVFGLKHILPHLLVRTDLKYTFISAPILITSFGFHNMIPSITAYLNGDMYKVKKAILGGGLMALAIYLVWNLIILGVVPIDGKNGLVESLHLGQDASIALAKILGATWVSGFAQTLAFFAILTSFLAQSLALVHFWADGLNVSHIKKENLSLCAISLVPPLIFSVLYPQIFFSALGFAGGICAVILFGLFPVLMVWIGRYRMQTESTYRVLGGKPLLIGIAAFAILIFVYQLATMLGFEFFPMF
jgi:tyrosine-specific transport protein